MGKEIFGKDFIGNSKVKKDAPLTPNPSEAPNSPQTKKWVDTPRPSSSDNSKRSKIKQTLEMDSSEIMNIKQELNMSNVEDNTPVVNPGLKSNSPIHSDQNKEEKNLPTSKNSQPNLNNL